MTYLKRITYQDICLIPLDTSMSSFMLELVNTPTWIKFIGQRNVTDLQDAKSYIEKILNTKDFYYWAIADSNNTLVGVISFLKRDNLAYFDLGFALLPQYAGKGLAFKGATALLQELKQIHTTPVICAITDPSNHRSIALLNKLGFKLEDTIFLEDQHLLLLKYKFS